MDREARGRRRELFRFAARLYGDTAAAMQTRHAAPERYKILGRRLSGQGRKLRRIDRDAQSPVTQMIADGAKAVGAVLPDLQVKCSKAERLGQAERLAGGLEHLSDAFRLGAQSLQLIPLRPRRGSSRSGPGRSETANAQIQAVFDQAVALAREYHVMALAVREAAGLDLPEARQSFTVPALDESCCETCACGDPAIRRPALPPEALGERRQPALRKARPRVSERQLLILVGQLDETSLVTAGTVAALGDHFGVAIVGLALAACSDQCAPVELIRVSGYISAVRDTPRGFFPTLGFRWLQCCDCSCAWLLKQQRQVLTLTINQITVLDPQPTQSEAFRVAARRSDELVAAFNSSLTSGRRFQSPSDIAPALEPPRCNC